MTKKGISQLRLFALSLLIAVSQTAPAFADQTNTPGVKASVLTPVAAPPASATAPAGAAAPAGAMARPASTTTATATVKVSPAALTNDGIRAIADGRYSDAIKVLEQAIALDATNATTRSNLAMAYNNLALQQAKTDQALAMKTLRKSLTINPNQTLARQNFDSMVRHFGRDPASFDDRVELGHLARQDKDNAGMIFEYKAALAIHKDSNVEELLKEALAPPKVYPVRSPRPAVSVQPNANVPPIAPKPGVPSAAPNSGAAGASAPLPAPATAPAAAPATAPAAVPPTAPAIPVPAPTAVPATAPRSNPNPN